MMSSRDLSPPAALTSRWMAHSHSSVAIRRGQERPGLVVEAIGISQLAHDGPGLPQVGQVLERVGAEQGRARGTRGPCQYLLSRACPCGVSGNGARGPAGNTA